MLIQDSSNHFVQPGFDCYAHTDIEYSSFIKNDERRYATYVEMLHDLRIGLRVDLNEAHGILVGCCGLFEDWSHDSARGAPWRPEIDNHGLFGFQNIGLPLCRTEDIFDQS